MSTKFSPATNLSSLIDALLKGGQTRQQLNETISLCHGLATVFLRRKIAGAMLQSRFHYSSYRDLAYDCIAELFRQDDSGALEVLQTFFGDLNVGDMDDAEVMIHLRRLISARVNQELFRIFGEIDPALTKVLRNIKLALHEFQAFTVISRFGESYLIPAVTDRNGHLPPIDARALECELSKTTCGISEVPGMLSALAKFLREQSDYSRMVPLMTVARVFRCLIGRHEGFEEAVELEDRFLIPDTLTVIRKTCRRVKEEMEGKYTGPKKVAEDLFQQYCMVVERAMIQKYVGDDDADRTLFETFKSVNPAMTREEYYQEHRSVVEYLARITHQQIADRLRAELSID
jgi:hypothetical protein